MNRSPNLHRTLPFSTILAHRTHTTKHNKTHWLCQKTLAER